MLLGSFRLCDFAEVVGSCLVRICWGCLYMLGLMELLGLPVVVEFVGVLGVSGCVRAVKFAVACWGLLLELAGLVGDC